eukprot:5059955-Prymnesium_polylepis.3
MASNGCNASQTRGRTPCSPLKIKQASRSTDLLIHIGWRATHGNGRRHGQRWADHAAQDVLELATALVSLSGGRVLALGRGRRSEAVEQSPSTRYAQKHIVQAGELPHDPSLGLGPRGRRRCALKDVVLDNAPVACRPLRIEGGDALLVRVQERVPKVDDQHQPRLARLVPHLVLKRVVKKRHLALHPPARQHTANAHRALSWRHAER